MAKSKVEVKDTVSEEEAVDTESKESEGEMLSTGTTTPTSTAAPTTEPVSTTAVPKAADSDGGSAASIPEKPVSVDELLSAVRYLAGQVSSNAELAELRQAFPRIFK